MFKTLRFSTWIPLTYLDPNPGRHPSATWSRLRLGNSLCGLRAAVLGGSVTPSGLPGPSVPLLDTGIIQRHPPFHPFTHPSVMCVCVSLSLALFPRGGGREGGGREEGANDRESKGKREGRAGERQESSAV
jgi:hypothetical protein